MKEKISFVSFLFLFYSSSTNGQNHNNFQSHFINNNNQHYSPQQNTQYYSQNYPPQQNYPQQNYVNPPPQSYPKNANQAASFTNPKYNTGNHLQHRTLLDNEGPQLQPHPQQQYQPQLLENNERQPFSHRSGSAASPASPGNRNANTEPRSSNPLHTLLTRAKSWFSAGDPQERLDSSPPKMRDMNRLPKPPKYPLYDLESISMATPPPAPLMHPMSSLPSEQYTSYYQTQQGFYGNNEREAPTGGGSGPAASSRKGHHHPERSRPPHNSNSNNNNGNSGGRRPRPEHYRKQKPHGKPHPHPPPRSYHPGNSRRPPHPQQSHHQNKNKNKNKDYDQEDHYFSHPMATNLDPVKTSPALGRPLGFDEYMARPSHSYVDDPWNFDPFANQMNQGLNTHALKYNYDPLGMNNLEMTNNPSMSHLDPTKLSYPGDSFLTKDTQAGGSSQYAQYADPNNFRSSGSNTFNSNNPTTSQNTVGASLPVNYGQTSDYKNSGYSNYQSPAILPMDSSPSASSSHRQSMSSNNNIQTMQGNKGKVEFRIETMTTADGKNIVNIEQTNLNKDGISQVYNPVDFKIAKQSDNFDPATPTDMLPPVENINYYTDYPLNKVNNG